MKTLLMGVAMTITGAVIIAILLLISYIINLVGVLFIPILFLIVSSFILGYAAFNIVGII
jgi:hypothetical protein